MAPRAARSLPSRRCLGYAEWRGKESAGSPVIAVVVVLANLAVDLLYASLDSAHTLAQPSAEFWLGTDELGRDVWSRVVHGSRILLVVGLASTLLGAVMGGLVALLSGHAGGKTDLLSQGHILPHTVGLTRRSKTSLSPLAPLAPDRGTGLGGHLARVVDAGEAPISEPGLGWLCMAIALYLAPEA